MSEAKNMINITTLKDSYPVIHSVNMILTPYTASIFKELYSFEILIGETIHLPDGMVQYKFTISDDEAKILKRAISNAYFGDPDERIQ